MKATSQGPGRGKGNGIELSTSGEAYTPPPDGLDISKLRIKSKQGDPLTMPIVSKVPVGKPKDFFRTVPDKGYRDTFEIYIHKVDNVPGETPYLIGPALQGQIAEAQPCLLVTIVDRAGNPRLWPIKLPKEDGKDYAAWSTARDAARTGLTQWVRIIYAGNDTGYTQRAAEPGYAPEPDYDKLPPFEDLIGGGFGAHGIVHDKTHPIYRGLFGLAEPVANAAGDDPLL
jgi:hypothetical protein